MIRTIPFDISHSFHIGRRSILKHYLFRYHSFDQYRFSKRIIISPRLSNHLLCCQFNLFPHQVHDPDLQFVLAVLGLFELPQVDEALLLWLVVWRVGLELPLELENRVVVIAVVGFPLEL